MKYLKLLEEYAKDRVKKRERETFDNRSMISKNREYNVIIITSLISPYYRFIL